MIKWYNILLTLVLLSGLVSCVEEYWPNIDKYENLLVVDGLVTNGVDTTVVSLSISTSINDSKLLPLSGAQVYISDQDNVMSQLIEMEIGSYKIPASEFIGKVGDSYQLHINHPNGNKYVSDISTLLEPSPIDSVYSSPDSYELTNGDHPVVGLQFYIDNHGLTADTCNYLWRLSQTYKYQSSFTLDYIWEGAMIQVENPDSLRTCWRTKPVQQIFTYSTRYLDNTKITKFPLNFVSTDTKMLSMRYSLFVEQLTIEDRAFSFWDALQKQNISQENLYTQQPVQIRGNVRNVLDEDEVVLGYFTVAGVTKKRVYVNRPASLTFYYSVCDPDFESMMMVAASTPTFWPIFITNIPGAGMALGASDVCFDCRLEGGGLNPPNFWEE